MKGQGRTVLIAFSATALLFALIFLLLGQVLIPQDEPPVSVSDIIRLLLENDTSAPLLPEEDTLSPDADDTVTLLLTGLDYRPEDFDDYRADAPDAVGALGAYARTVEADFIAVLCVNTTAKEISVVSLPESMELTLSGASVLLKEVYGEYGDAYFRRLIASLVGFDIDYSLAVNICDIGQIVELAGNAVVSVPCNMYLENDRYTASPKTDSATLLLAAGNQYITKNNVVWLLSFNDYPNGGSRAETVISFANTLTSRLTTLENLLRIDELYTAVARAVNTDVTLADVQKHISILLSYASYTVKTQTYPGTYSSDREAFYPDTEGAIAAFAPYR
ncbi:MAG: LCP family protein [Clostridia bacterium]|nr:LCP family protein [Clostridia bacterium]